jgi:glycerol uptake operon antiterminator
MMHDRFSSSLLKLSEHRKVVPVIEHKTQFARIFDQPSPRAILLRHCNLFELASSIERAHQSHIATYVNIDSIDGIHADAAGLHYLCKRMKITGVVSSHPRVLAIAKGCGLETIQRIFVLDSTGLETVLESLDTSVTDIFDISPALVIPHVISWLRTALPLPFLASGLLHTSAQIQMVLQYGARGAFVSRDELWNVA